MPCPLCLPQRSHRGPAVKGGNPQPKGDAAGCAAQHFGSGVEPLTVGGWGRRQARASD